LSENLNNVVFIDTGYKVHLKILAAIFNLKSIMLFDFPPRKQPIRHTADHPSLTKEGTRSFLIFVNEDYSFCLVFRKSKMGGFVFAPPKSSPSPFWRGNRVRWRGAVVRVTISFPSFSIIAVAAKCLQVFRCSFTVFNYRYNMVYMQY